MTIDITKLVADKGSRPLPGQSYALFGSKPPVGESEDLDRVLKLPRRPIVNENSTRSKALVAMMTERYHVENSDCDCASMGRECITRLRPVQAWALYEIGLQGGLLGSIGVGHGKTILDILTPLAVPGCINALLLVPPLLISQLIKEYDLLKQHFRVPSLVLFGKYKDDDRKTDDRGVPGLNIYPYSALSRPESTTFLNWLKPDLIIADETHKLRHRDTATTSRVLRYFKDNPDTKFCGWSGSITDSSIKDYAHLSAMSLRHGSPVPINRETVEEWSSAIDPLDVPSPPGALFSLCDPGESVHSGFYRRFVETQGVVTTEEPSIDADLRIDEKEAPEVPYRVKEAIRDLRESWQRPDGEELIDALAVARCARELASGFFYRWRFSRGETVENIEEWLAARKNWCKELRYKLQRRDEHLDSPKLCFMAAYRAWSETPYKGDLPVWKADSFPRWLKVKATVVPETEAVRVDDYLAQDAAEWGKSNHGIVWYDSRCFGAWVSEISGLPLHCGGPKAGEFIAAERGDRSIVASIKSHGTGRDGLQRLYMRQLVAQPPSSATSWEQLMGRLTRIGQKSKVVITQYYAHTKEFRDAIEQARKRAEYVESTTGNTQKLLGKKKRIKENGTF